MTNAYFCVDIGGTKTACAIYGEDGEELFYTRFPTEPARGAEDLLERVYQSAREALEKYRILKGAIASPGPLDIPRGRIVHVVTMGWTDVPLVALFEARFGFSFVLLNDCDAGALGVATAPDFQWASSLCYISLSTGIGGGAVFGGRLYTGNGNAANFGHMPVVGEGIRCGCGNTDCLELYASGSGIECRYERKTGVRKSCAEIEALAKAGDALACALFSEASEYLAFALNAIRAIVDPELIVLGGSVCRAGKLILGDAEQHHRIGFAPDDGKQVLKGAFAYAKQSEKES